MCIVSILIILRTYVGKKKKKEYFLQINLCVDDAPDRVPAFLFEFNKILTFGKRKKKIKSLRCSREKMSMSSSGGMFSH